ncbi:MAG: head-tail connector protein [Acutalibacteraceae bacterium]
MADISEQFVYDIRRYLRISHTRFDAEITDLIGAARADLLLGGIKPAKVNNEKDPLIKRAIVCYVKAEFGLDNADAEKYRESYEMLKRHLMLSSEYIEEA